MLSCLLMRNAMLRGVRRFLQPIGFAAAAAFALSTSGCLSVIGVQSSDLTFPLDKKPGASTFWAWNEITVDQDLSSINAAKIVDARISIEAPAGADFGFLKSIKGEAVNEAGRVPVVELDAIPAGEPDVYMRILYVDDVRPLFKSDNHTFRLEWTGVVDPNYPNWPEGGYTIKATVSLDIE